MELMGYEVTFYPVELRKTWQKVVRTLSNRAYHKELDNFHSRIIEKEQHCQYDYIIFLQVHTFSMSNFMRLKKDATRCKVHIILMGCPFTKK